MRFVASIVKPLLFAYALSIGSAGVVSADTKCLGSINDKDAILWIEQSPHQFSKPNPRCTTYLCLNLLSLINNAKSNIEFAVFGFRGQVEILAALLNAQGRGVIVRGVVDKTIDNKNYYSDTKIWQNRLGNVRDDYQADKMTARLIEKSKRKMRYRFSGNLMHNKFFIIDRQYLWTGSANISDTGIGGYNANNAVIVNSSALARVYRAEFESMYSGKYHRKKTLFKKQSLCVNVGNQRVNVYFSPQSYTTNRGILPVIENARESIDVAMFFLTSHKITKALIRARQRGVKVRIILDATGADNKYSQHQYLRDNGVTLKVESWGGKMHMKSALIDDRYLIVGSMNWTKAGTGKNDENTLIIEANQDLANSFNLFFNDLWQSIPDKWLHADPAPESRDSGTSCFDGIDNNFDRIKDRMQPSC